MSLKFEEIIIPGYERVVKISDPSVNLTGIVAIHSLALGPTLGGTRIYPYQSFSEALTDALRLSKGMTYKSAMADVGIGGGKSVIICDPRSKTEDLLRRWGEAINRFNGLYIAAEDMGCTAKDLAIVNQTSQYVVGLIDKNSSGDPSPYTSFGTFRGIQAMCAYLFGDPSLQGKKIALQGLGSVGLDLLKRLFWAGAELIVSDIDEQKSKEIARQYGAKWVSPDQILFEECDILAPCAIGGILNKNTIPKLSCKAVAGPANNQLLEEIDAKRLMERNILYAPDFVINAGGLHNVATEILPEGYNPIVSREKISQIYDKILGILQISAKNSCSTYNTAISLADYRLKYKIGVRSTPPCFHHALTRK